jgi:hypothetical protein
VPYVVQRLSFGQLQEDNVPGLYDGRFPLGLGLHLAGMVGHDFFKPYAVTFDFENMQITVAPKLLVMNGHASAHKNKQSPRSLPSA